MNKFVVNGKRKRKIKQIISVSGQKCAFIHHEC